MTIFRRNCIFLSLLAMILPGPAENLLAQEVIVEAYTNQSCAGTRARKNLSCVANDFTADAVLTQPSATALTSCIAGRTITLDTIVNLHSSNPRRYDAGIFFGEHGNNPGVNNPDASCSLGVFPTAPAPFYDADGDQCGDHLGGSSTAELLVTGISITCLPAPGLNVLGIPYTLTWESNSNFVCSPSNLGENTANPKCRTEMAGQVTEVIVQGFVEITKQTVPAGSAQSFSLSASGSAPPDPAAFSLADGQTQLIQIPLHPEGGDRTLTITEAPVPGWDSTATINCTDPSGEAAPYVSVDNASRTITAILNEADHGARCTVTSHQLIADLALTKEVDIALPHAGQAVTFTLTATNSGPDDATSVVTDDPLPSGYTFVSAVPDAGTYNETTGVWAIGSLEDGANATLTITAAVNYSGEFTNTAVIGSAEHDPDSGNNTAIAGVHVLPNLTLMKMVQTYSDPINGTFNPLAIPGAEMLYTIIATNFGGATDADSVIIADPIPAGTALMVGGTPVTFIDGATSSGLIFTFGGLADLTDSVGFSSNGGVTFDYIPTPDADGVDTGITHLRINPEGIFNPSDGTSHPSFTVRFKTRIK